MMCDCASDNSVSEKEQEPSVEDDSKSDASDSISGLAAHVAYVFAKRLGG